MTGSIDPLLQELVIMLSDPDRPIPASRFENDAHGTESPGLYSWWAADDARAVMSKPFGSLLPSLIYAGQAGATSTRSRTERAATLRSRVRGNHLNGNIGSSTFRKTLAAVLLRPLELSLAAPCKLDRASNAKLSAWMRENLRIAVVPYADRGELAVVEHHVLAALDPPLNLMGMPATPIR